MKEKNKWLQVRVSEKELNLYKEFSKKIGVGVSQLVRMSVKDYIYEVNKI